MTISLARLLSFIFNPVFLLVLVPFFVVFRSTHNLLAAVHWTLYTVVFLIAMGLFLIYAVKKGIFTDLDVSKREQRPLLFIVSIILGVIYLVGLYLFHAPFILFEIIFGIILGIFITSLINQRIKASMHVATITAIIIAFVITYGSWSYLLLLLIPTIAWARLKIKRHTLPETIVGGLLGTILALSLYILIKFMNNYSL